MNPSRTLWLGNLDPGINEEDIRELFKEISKIN